MITDEVFAFHFSSDEYKRLRKYISSRPGERSPLVVVVLAAFYAFTSLGEASRHRWFLAGLFAFLVATALISFLGSTKSRKLTCQGNLRLTDAGLIGTLDNKHATIKWSDIATVHDNDDVVLLRRKSLGPIAIPKSAIPDVAAFWALLDDRLVSKRGLIRSAGQKRQILNTAC